MELYDALANSRYSAGACTDFEGNGDETEAR